MMGTEHGHRHVHSSLFRSVSHLLDGRRCDEEEDEEEVEEEDEEEGPSSDSGRIFYVGAAKDVNKLGICTKTDT